MSSHRLRTTLPLILGIALFCGAILARSSTAQIYDQILTDEDRYYLPPATWLRAFSIGYNEAAADVFWATTLVYFGGKENWIKRGASAGGQDDTAVHTVNYLDLVTSLDPRFRGAYRSGGRLTLYHQGRITRQSVEMAIALLEKGLVNFPDDGEIAFNLGFLHYYEMIPYLPGPNSSPQKKRSRQKGVAILRRAAHMNSAPPYSSILSSTLMIKEGLDNLVVEHLKAMLIHETSPSIRRSLEAQLFREIGKAADRDIKHTRELHSEWKREIPYVPFDLFLLTRPNTPVTAQGITAPEFLGEDL